MFNMAAEEHNWVAWYKAHLNNMEISAKCVTYLCQPGNHVHARSLHCG